MHDNEYCYEDDHDLHAYEAYLETADIRPCPGCHKDFDRCDLEEVYDDQGIYAGLYCSYECCERNGRIRLHRTNQEAFEAGDWGDDEY